MLVRLAVCTALIASAGCASSPAARTVSGPISQWTGSFRSSTTSNSGTLGPAMPNRGIGTVTLTPLKSSLPQTRVDLSVSVPTGGQDQVAWGVFNGGCGTPGPMVGGSNIYPPISISSSGEGHLRTELSFSLEPRSTYHVNVYWTARNNDMNDVMMCANIEPQS